MIEEQFPALEVRPVALDAASPLASASFTDRVLFGGPAVTAISRDYHPEDADLQAFIAGSDDRWAIVLLAITFPLTEGPPLGKAKVAVNLSDDGDPSNTVAFSLLPLSSGTPYDQTNSYTLSPSMTAGPVGISLGSVGKTVEDHGTRTFLIGGPEISATTAWTFTPTKTQKIVGSSRLSMTVRAPQGRIGRISVHLEAEMVERHLLFGKKRTPLPLLDPADVTF